MTIKVQLVDDHTLMRYSLRDIITKSPGSDIVVVCESSTGEDAIEHYMTHRPDVVIMDITLPNMNGIEAMRKILARDPSAKFVMYSMHGNEVVINKAIRSGAKGYMEKRSDALDLVKAITRVANGEIYFPTNIAYRLALSKTGVVESIDPADTLSEREYEVFVLLAKGKTTSDIASILKIDIKTVQLYARHVTEKLKANSHADLTMIAIKYCIIPIKD